MENLEIPLLPNKVYHIFNHANGFENLFVQDGNCDFFLKKYTKFIEPIAVTYAYCLMPNHVHFMIKIRDVETLQQANEVFKLSKKIPPNQVPVLSEIEIQKFLSKTFGNLFSAYAQAFNKQQGRIGSLFMPNFKRKEVTNKKYFTTLVHYIHNNPVHHGFVNEMDDWLYSSYDAYFSAKNTRIEKEEVIKQFGGFEGFQKFHKSQQDYKVIEETVWEF